MLHLVFFYLVVFSKKKHSKGEPSECLKLKKWVFYKYSPC